MSTFNIILLCVSEIFGDFKLKDYARYGKSKDLLSGIFGYVFVIYFLIQSLTKGNILYINGMWDGISSILESVAACFILGEKFNYNYQYFGLFLIIVGVALIHSGGISH
jgi:multidrug transporter EmrE-like cation transporter